MNILRCVVLSLIAVPVAAQFEVASVKPSKPGATVQDMRLVFEGNRFVATCTTVKDILRAMSGFKWDVIGGPKWADTDRFDIEAKSPVEIVPAERNKAVLTLLKDRFQLESHSEMKESSGLALTIGKNPPQLQPAKAEELPGIRQGEHRLVILEAQGMFGFTTYLSRMLHTTVMDRTGLKGKFDFSLDPDSFALGQEQYADLIRAATEHLGFVLQNSKVTVGMTIIDRIERPGEN
jgi:uncharacterized protein (TIGR03435 family)